MFRTELHPSPLPYKIHLTDPVLTIGSCFSETIGQQLADHKFNVCINPFGTVYNPISIHRLVELCLKKQLPDEAGYAQRDDVYFHYDFHSRFAALSLNDLKHSLYRTVTFAHDSFQQTNWLMITYGTAWVYKLKSTDRIVANCHKMPGPLFIKELLSLEKIIESFNKLYLQLKACNPDLHILLTVSPVRHVRDTLELNSVSKSVLRMACHTLCNTYSGVHYFPAYEILLDDLRDYRFYASDLIHPSEEAGRYIWQKFTEACMDDHARNFINEWSSISQALSHRPALPGSKSHKRFLEDTIRRLEKLKGTVNVQNEIEALTKQLHES